MTTTRGLNAVERVAAACDRIERVDRPEIWITLRDRGALMAEAARIDARPPGPLAGRLLAVKDNIDVAGLPTTAACPPFAYEADQDAPAVARLRAAGAIVLGKTNLDQFATGLVGTRSPYGAVRDAARPTFISGGSSSGSAVAVALGLADLGLGTDTAGSGRVPAAFQGLVGIKPTRGLVSTAGVVPACRTFDCVSVLSTDVASGELALWLMAEPSSDAPLLDVGTRSWPPAAPLAAPPAPRIAIPDGSALSVLSADGHRAFADAVRRCADLGGEIRELDLEPFLAAGRLLYGGAFVAERYAAVGDFVAAHLDQTDPSVRQIITAAGEVRASRLVSDGQILDDLRHSALAQLADADALLVPTAPRQPTIAEVAGDPLVVNAELGRFTSFANLLDLCAVAVPAGRAEGGHFGITLLAPAFGDRVLADLAARFLDEPASPAVHPGGIPLLVVGAHRRGEPLNHQLTSRGARFLGAVNTSADYQMYALATEPAKPGMLRVADGGVRIEGELWDLPSAGLGPFLAALPQPMALGHVTLEDGRSVVGFQCEPIGLEGATDISAYGSWPNYLANSARRGRAYPGES